MQAPHHVVVAAFLGWQRSLGQVIDATAATLAQGLELLPPLHSWPTRRLLIEHGRGWTCCVDNAFDGGDPVSLVGPLSNRLNAHGIIATHQPMIAARHASTQFEYLGPEGEPPLNSIRTVSAGASDGRWTWHTSGEPLEFEDDSRYRARRICDRFDRDLLIDYLARLDVRPDEPASFGAATLAVQRDTSGGRTLSLDQAREFWSIT